MIRVCAPNTTSTTSLEPKNAVGRTRSPDERLLFDACETLPHRNLLWRALFRCGQRWDVCRADTSLGRDKLQCPASECYGFKIDPGRQKFGQVVLFVAIVLALVAALWALNRFGDIDGQREAFLISQDEAQAARVTTFAIVVSSAVAVCFLLVLSKWLVGGTRNSEWWRIWHFGDTKPFTAGTPDVKVATRNAIARCFEKS